MQMNAGTEEWDRTTHKNEYVFLIGQAPFRPSPSSESNIPYATSLLDDLAN